MATRPLILLLCGLVLGAAACGAEDDEAAGAGTPVTQLVVRVDDDGPRGPAEPRELRLRCESERESAACEAAGALKPGHFEPVPDDVACTQIFGGPQTARVTGELRGTAVASDFGRANGCEIQRWDAVAELLAQVR